MDSADLLIQRVIATISSSDPLVKLLEQVRLGRMKPTDAGLRAITESWIATYKKSIETAGLTKNALRRIDPTPRLAVLMEHGLLPHDHPEAYALQSSFERAMMGGVAE